MGSSARRIHHLVDWDATAVKIVAERYRKPDSRAPRRKAGAARAGTA
jgi:hypothetical protein